MEATLVAHTLSPWPRWEISLQLWLLSSLPSLTGQGLPLACCPHWVFVKDPTMILSSDSEQTWSYPGWVPESMYVGIRCICSDAGPGWREDWALITDHFFSMSLHKPLSSDFSRFSCFMCMVRSDELNQRYLCLVLVSFGKQSLKARLKDISGPLEHSVSSGFSGGGWMSMYCF